MGKGWRGSLVMRAAIQQIFVVFAAIIAYTWEKAVEWRGISNG
jgi:hypothetical protein